MSEHRDTPRVGPGVAANAKLAEQIAYRLETRIRDAGWPVGEVIGHEPDFLAEFGVSRSAFREAVRLLEHHSIASMRRGSNGGLVVTAPNTSSLIRSSALNLQYNGATASDIFDARSALELKIVELATERMDEKGVIALREVLDREEALQDAGKPLGMHDIHVTIAELSGNPAMRLFLEVLTSLTFPSAREAPDVERKRGRDTRSAHRRIVEAMVAGDVHLARHRMLTHLKAIRAFIEESGDISVREVPSDLCCVPS